LNREHSSPPSIKVTALFGSIALTGDQVSTCVSSPRPGLWCPDRVQEDGTLTSSGSHFRLRSARSRSYRSSRSSASRRVCARPSRLAALDGHRWTGAASDRSVAGRRSQEQGRTATAANGLFERVIVAAVFAAGLGFGVRRLLTGRLATREQKEGDRETRLGYRDPRIDEACARYPCGRGWAPDGATQARRDGSAAAFTDARALGRMLS
jgi:hypothetical protein